MQDNSLTQKNQKLIDDFEQYLSSNDNSNQLDQDPKSALDHLFLFIKSADSRYLALSFRILDKLIKTKQIDLILDSIDKSGSNLIHIAVKFKQNEFLNFLLSNFDLLKISQKINALDKNRNTPLLIAIKNGNHQAIEILHHHGADLNLICRRFTPLQSAIILDQEQCFHTLIALESNPNNQDEDQRNCYSLTQEFSYCHKFFKPLIEYHLQKKIKIANINQTDYHGRSILIFAFKIGLENSIIESLIDDGADINYRSEVETGSNIFHLAVYFNNLNLVKSLLCKGAQINLGNSNGDRALHLAINHNNLEIIIELLKNGADKNLKNNNGENAIDLCKNYLINQSFQSSNDGQEVRIKGFGNVLIKNILQRSGQTLCRNYALNSSLEIDLEDKNLSLEKYLISLCDNKEKLDLVLDFFSSQIKPESLSTELIFQQHPSSSIIHELTASFDEEDNYEIVKKIQTESILQIKKLSSKIASIEL